MCVGVLLLIFNVIPIIVNGDSHYIVFMLLFLLLILLFKNIIM